MHDGDAIGLGQERHHRLLPVRHEAGMHIGLYVDGCQPLAGAEKGNGPGVHFEPAADLSQRIQERDQGGLIRPFDAKPTAGRDGRHREGRHFDTVANRVVVRAMKPVHALDDDLPVGIDLNEGAHLLQEEHRIDDLRLHRRVVDHGRPFRQACREDRVLGGADTGVGERYHGTPKPIRLGGIAVVVLVDFRPHLPQQVDVEVDGPFSDVATADHGHPGRARPMEQRRDQQDGDPVDPGIALADRGRRDAGRCYVDGAVFAAVTRRADFRQHIQDHIDFSDVRHIVEPARFGREKGGDELLGYRVLRGLGANAPAQRAMSAYSVHVEIGVGHRFDVVSSVGNKGVI